jgi:predicted tellurium resistance membrane protein TerC
MDWLFDAQAWAALVTLTVLEIVLGIDNIVFISILAGRLPAARQKRARRVGLALAMVSRIALLASIAWIVGLTRPLFALLGHDFSGRDLILLGGGLFLIWKATKELHERLEGEGEHRRGRAAASFGAVIAQILLVDVVFSLDSVITAVGMAEDLWVMITAIVIAMIIMMISVEPISDFVHRHPTVKVLALSFLLLIGVALIAEGFGRHIPKGYLYFAMGFSIFVEMINLRVRRGAPVELREPYAPPGGTARR